MPDNRRINAAVGVSVPWTPGELRSRVTSAVYPTCQPVAVIKASMVAVRGPAGISNVVCVSSLISVGWADFWLISRTGGVGSAAWASPATLNAVQVSSIAVKRWARVVVISRHPHFDRGCNAFLILRRIRIAEAETNGGRSSPNRNSGKVFSAGSSIGPAGG